MEYKKFFIRFIPFLVPLVLLFGFFEYRMRQIPSSYEAKRKFLDKAADSVQVLVLGNSHMLHGIDPDHFSKKGFNLASGFQNYFYDDAITEKYLDKLKNLKLVFISADYISFFYRIEDVADWIDYGYAQAWKVRHPDLSWWDSRNYSTFMLYTPMTSWKYLRQNDKLGLSRNVRANGFNPEDTTYRTMVNEEDGKFRADYHTRIVRLDRQEESKFYLEKLLTTLQKRNIKAVLIAPPVSPTYYKYLDPAIDQRSRQLIDSVVNKLGCPYKDYSKDNRFDSTDFHDNDHLSWRGAAKFTKILDEEFVKPVFDRK